MFTDRTHQLRTEIIQGVEKIETPEYLLRIQRLVRWCAAKEI